MSQETQNLLVELKKIKDMATVDKMLSEFHTSKKYSHIAITAARAEMRQKIMDKREAEALKNANKD